MTQIYKGKGVFCHPPICVIDAGEDSDLEKPPFHKARKKKFSEKLTDAIQVVVTNDGFIGLVMEGSDDEILEFINTLISIMMSKGQRSLYALEEDLCQFEYNSDTQVVHIVSNQVFSLRNRLEFERDNDITYSLWRMTPRDSVDVKTLNEWFVSALKFYQDDDLRNYLLLLGESWGLAYEKKFKASFLYAWIIVETALENYCLNHDSLSVEKTVLKNKVKNISNIIETLKKHAKIDSDSFQSIEKMRNLRNKLVHKITTEITSDDAHNCMHVANKILYNKFNQLESPFVNITLVK